ncbi:GTPase domain-containing protein [Nostoc sp.]|uniref:GTPase domain-containing protein n=1 Tax=Nostoc sp. TaxID=1180 RepID=UPI002FF6135F
MNRTEKINSIISKRKPLNEKLKKVQKNLVLLNSEIHKLEKLQQTTAEKLSTIPGDPQFLQALQEIDFSKIKTEITIELKDLEKLSSRFARNTLNLGVVGIARQGKSRLLQSLTGLSTTEIPDSDKGFCTGARCTIHHRPEVATYGIVYFHSEQTFLNEIIRPYFEKLRLGAAPDTLAEFALPLPPLPDELDDAVSKAQYRYLEKYHTNLDKYQSLLLEAQNKQIQKHEIREYVAQNDSEGNHIYFKYMAVQKVELFCEFPNTDIGNIALVDMPGLGETGIGAEEQLIKILGEEVDAAIFVRFPKSTGDDWDVKDVELYSTANKALRLPIKEWSFMVLNKHKNGENLELCEYFAKSLDKQVIEVVKPIIIANCADPTEAKTKILDQILDYLIKNLERLDLDYSNFCYQELLRIHNAVSTELEKARRALGELSRMGNDAIEVPDFRPLFSSVWGQLTNKLEELLKEIREDAYKGEISTIFQNQLEQIEEACDQSREYVIPEKVQIEMLRNQLKSYDSAYSEYLHKCRTHLSREFLKIDAGLEELINDVKSKVTNVLVDADGGMLGSLTDQREAEFLEYMADNLPEHPSLQRIKEGFEILSNFKISYRNLFQHRIRQHLNCLTPDLTARLKNNPDAEDVLMKIDRFYDQGLSLCLQELEKFSTEPADAAFGIVEEFVDQVLRSDGAEQGWERFYYQERAQVWDNKFAQERKLNGIRQDWLNAIERVAQYNKREFL